MARLRLKIILQTLVSLAVASALVGLIFATSLFGTGERMLGPVENIHGIPYPQGSNGLHIDESLAHADLYLTQPVLGKKIILTVAFVPTNISGLSVGVRENNFWLSYEKQQLASSPAILEIPLTNKLQEPDQSVDLMFFAEGEAPEWELVSMKAELDYTWPTWAELKDYVKAVVYKERAL